jgi:hypothetical protein
VRGNIVIGEPLYLEVLSLGADQTQVLTVDTACRHYRLKGLSESWLAGTPEEGGVVCLPGGELLLSARPPDRRLRASPDGTSSSPQSRVTGP